MSPIILAQTEMIWICTRLQRVIVAENLTNLRIDKARWCKRRNSPTEESKSNKSPVMRVSWSSHCVNKKSASDYERDMVEKYTSYFKDGELVETVEPKTLSFAVTDL